MKSFGHSDRIIALGRVLHSAALNAEAIINAIPEDVDVRDECEVIDAASEPVFTIAEMIVRMPCQTGEESTVRSRAQAWIDGYYWKTLEIAA